MSERPKWMPSDEEIRASIEGTEIEYDSEIGVFTDVSLEPIRALIREAVRAHDSERFGQYLLDMRGIDGEPCRECGGVGVKAYGDTSTWRGGVGGQMITNAVCDRCWGSGDPDRPWVNLRTLKSDQGQAIRAAVEKALAEQEARHAAEVTTLKEEIRQRDYRLAEQAVRMLQATEEIEARHKREVLGAKLEAIHGIPFTEAGGFLKVREERLTGIMEELCAELAALDAGEGAK